MGERRQVTGGSDRTLRGHDRQEILVEHLDQPCDDLGPYAAVSLGQGPGPQSQHRPHQFIGQPEARPRRHGS